mmetsp:Transcript_19707/g.54807  ORF Transcript_19707/g.54807 Transcript_19707/m.54807 type:complete len:207 (+) Transcript_19707:294-914(+)
MSISIPFHDANHPKSSSFHLRRRRGRQLDGFIEQPTHLDVDDTGTTQIGFGSLRHDQRRVIPPFSRWRLSATWHGRTQRGAIVVVRWFDRASWHLEGRVRGRWRPVRGRCHGTEGSTQLAISRLRDAPSLSPSLGHLLVLFLSAFVASLKCDLRIGVGLLGVCGVLVVAVFLRLEREHALDVLQRKGSGSLRQCSIRMIVVVVVLV